MRAFSKGAPVRILAPAFTGTGDLYWYVQADSPIKSLKDATDAATPSPIRPTARARNNIVLAFVDELGVKAKPTATGSPPATLTAVMSGQIDIGWAAPPFGLQEIKDGKIRIIARGSDVPSLRGQTVRVLIVNANVAQAAHGRDRPLHGGLSRDGRLDVCRSRRRSRCMPKKIDEPIDLVQRVDAGVPARRTPLQTDEMADLDGVVRDAVKLKFLDEPLTKEQLAELIQIPPRAK